MLVSFFSLPLWIPGENRAKLKKPFTLNSRCEGGGEYNIPDTQNILIIFLSAIAVIQVIFLTAGNFCFISDCRNSFNCFFLFIHSFIQLINKQIIIFYSPSNALCSSDKSVQIKHFKYHIFIGICYLYKWFNLQILNFCQLRHNEQMCKCALS